MPTRLKIPNVEIKCACGCGTHIMKYDQRGREHKWVAGHSWRGKKRGTPSLATREKLRQFNLGRKMPQNIKDVISFKNSGERSYWWKGGRRNLPRGYIYVYSPNHPYADKRKRCVLEHRLVVEDYIGRFLLPEEVVHHINGKKDDNRIENLMLFKNNSEHMKYEAEHPLPGRKFGRERGFVPWNKGMKGGVRV